MVREYKIEPVTVQKLNPKTLLPVGRKKLSTKFTKRHSHFLTRKFSLGNLQMLVLKVKKKQKNF